MHDPRQARALVIVPDEQLSLAIGREGQNVRLAAKLTGFKLDIKSISQVEQDGGMAYYEQLAAPPADYVPEAPEGELLDGSEVAEGEPALVAAGDIASEDALAADLSGAVASDEAYEAVQEESPESFDEEKSAPVAEEDEEA